MKNVAKTTALSAALAIACAIILPQTAHATGVVAAPELDPSSAFAALSLLSGVLMAVRGRRAGKK